MVVQSTSLMSPRDLGGLNRARVLRALADHGPLSRSDLARMAGVARATIGTIVQGLLDDELLEELEPIDAGLSGKPPRPLWFAAGAGSVVAVELRADGVRAALVDARGHVDDDQVIPLRDATSGAEVNRVVRSVAVRLARSRAVIGVGIAVPGSTDVFAGEVIASSQTPGAAGRSLVDVVARSTNLPTFVENDSRAQALAEQWFGAGRGRRTFTSVQTGDGVGVGLVLDGTIYRGPHGFGEVGHHSVVFNGERCVCGLIGCWETIATLRWLRSEARRAGLPRSSSLDCKRLSVLAATGDVGASALLDRYADHLAVGLANVHQILGSTTFILHGDAVGGGDAFRRRVEEAACRRALNPVDVVLTELGDQATILGAVAVVLSELLHISA